MQPGLIRPEGDPEHAIAEYADDAADWYTCHDENVQADDDPDTEHAVPGVHERIKDVVTWSMFAEAVKAVGAVAKI